MVCPKCDTNWFNEGHCHFCGFVPTRQPWEWEMEETIQPNQQENDKRYSMEDYTVGNIPRHFRLILKGAGNWDGR